MPNYNKVFLMGNLTRDPELRMTPKGSAICQLGLAINRKWKDDTGAEREEVTFVDVDAFGRQAETICKYVKKGRPLFVEGRLKLDQWEDKASGEKKSKLKIVLESFQFIDSAQGAQGGGREAGPSSVQQPPGWVPANRNTETDEPPF